MTLYLETAATIERHRKRTFFRALWLATFTLSLVVVMAGIVQGLG